VASGFAVRKRDQQKPERFQQVKAKLSTVAGMAAPPPNSGSITRPKKTASP